MYYDNFKKGINLGGWLSQCNYAREHLDGFITEDDIRTVASWGADHVRIPFDYNIIEDNNGNFIEEGFTRLRNAVKVSLDAGLNVVLDLHKTAGFSFDYYGEDEKGFFDSAAYQERFYRIWERMAEIFGDRPENIAFELLNEITDEAFLPAWKRISAECIRRIRAIAPETMILLGSYRNNAADTVQFLDKLPYNNIVYNFHCYEPLKFTHQGAYWTTEIVPEERMAFEDSEASEEYFGKLFSTAIEKAKTDGVPLYCGEFGVIDVVSPEDTLKWYRTITNVLHKYDIGVCAWTYKAMDFGLSGERLAGVRDELLSIL